MPVLTPKLIEELKSHKKMNDEQISLLQQMINKSAAACLQKQNFSKECSILGEHLNRESEIILNMANLIVAQDARVKHLIFSGGGAKGAIYSGVLKELKESQVLANVETVCGSSAGAIAAAIVSAGGTSKDIFKIAKEDTSQLMRGRFLYKDTTNLANFLNKTLCAAIVSRLYSLKKDKDSASKIIAFKNYLEQKLEQVNVENEQEYFNLQRKNEFLEGVDNVSDLVNKFGKDRDVNFLGLDILSNIFPESFKKLVVTATKVENAELKLFNAKDNPGVSVSQACIASASIPAIFQTTTIDGVKYSDGGLVNNMPISALAAMGKGRDRILAFAFSEHNHKGNVFRAIHGSLASKKLISKNIMCRVINALAAFIGFKGFDHFEHQKKFYKDMRERALEVVSLKVDDIGVTDFKKAQAKFQDLQTRGQQQTHNHLVNYGIIVESQRQKPKPKSIGTKNKSHGILQKIKSFFF